MSEPSLFIIDAVGKTFVVRMLMVSPMPSDFESRDPSPESQHPESAGVREEPWPPAGEERSLGPVCGPFIFTSTGCRAATSFGEPFQMQVRVLGWFAAFASVFFSQSQLTLILGSPGPYLWFCLFFSSYCYGFIYQKKSF